MTTTEQREAEIVRRREIAEKVINLLAKENISVACARLVLEQCDARIQALATVKKPPVKLKAMGGKDFNKEESQE
jgi:hypothetical protein